MKRFSAPFGSAAILAAALLGGCSAGSSPQSSPEPPPTSSAPASSLPSASPGIHTPVATKPECHDVATEDHVRTQYVHFANELARSGYYKLGRSKSELVARPVMDILKIYYGGDALDQIIKLSAKWPVDVDVKHPDTTVNSFKFNEKCTFVELNTTEVWSVTKAKGGPIPELCLELGESHDVTLEQQSNRFTWKVTKITNFPACLQIPR